MSEYPLSASIVLYGLCNICRLNGKKGERLVKGTKYTNLMCFGHILMLRFYHIYFHYAIAIG